MLRNLLGEMEFDRLSREVNFGTVDEGVLLIFVGAENCAAEIKLHHLDDFAVAAEFALGQPSKYHPAKPGALGLGPLKAARWGR